MPRQVHPPKPSEALTLGVRAFIGHFFNVSDRPECNEEWVDSFCDEATLVMGPDVANGRQGLFTSDFEGIYISWNGMIADVILVIRDTNTKRRNVAVRGREEA